MFFPMRRTAALLILLPLGVMAQPVSNPADANLPASGARYVSAFEAYLTTKEDKGTPDQVWLSANRDVMPQQSQGGHRHGSPAPALPAPDSAGATRESGTVRTEHAPAAHQHGEPGEHGNHAHGSH